MRVIETIAEVRHQVAAARTRGERVGFVPTMGALHDGHRALIRVANAQCDLVVASIYVNPIQFGPGEDHDRYPRALASDTELADGAGADLLWCPTDDEMYGPRTLHGTRLGLATRISVGDLGTRLCGEFRPGHFDGVATVVVKLLGAVQPDVLYLGEKDYQQTIVVKQAVRDLNVPVDVRTVPTVRDADGLALSSRNQYLSTEERAAALALPRAIAALEQAVHDGERSTGRLRARAEIVLAEEPLVTPQYVEFVDPTSLEPVDAIDDTAMALIAVHVGTTRLIDNCRLTSTTSRSEAPTQTDSRQGAMQ